MNKIGSIIVVVLCLLTIAVSTGWRLYKSYREVTISEMKQNQKRYDDIEVWLTGTVQNVALIPGLTWKSYLISDGTGTIEVMTKVQLPQKGEMLFVRGKGVRGRILKGKSIDMTVEEYSHKSLDT